MGFAEGGESGAEAKFQERTLDHSLQRHDIYIYILDLHYYLIMLQGLITPWIIDSTREGTYLQAV